MIKNGDIKFNKESIEPIFDCLLCRSCKDECFSNIMTDEIMVSARMKYYSGLHLSQLLVKGI